jgi:hypothetical protein
MNHPFQSNNKIQYLLTSIWVLATIYVLFSQGFINFANDPGLGWHLKNGQEVLFTGIPYSDTFLSINRPWISDQWLSDLLLFLSVDRLGWQYSYLVLAFLFFAVIIILVNIARELDSQFTLILPILGAFIITRILMIHFIFRPVIFSFIIYSILIYLLKYIYRNQISRILSFVLLSLLFILWSNIHPSFVVGAVTLYIFLLVNNLNYLFALTPLFVLINPYGFDLINSIFSLVNNEYFSKLNIEWLPINIQDPEASGIILMLGFSLYGYYKLGLDNKFYKFILLTSLVLFLQSINSVRYVTYFAILNSPLFLVTLSKVEKKFIPVITTYFSIRIFKFFLTGLFLCFTYTYLNKKIIFLPAEKHIGVPQLEEVISIVKDYRKIQNLEEKIIIYNHPNYGGLLTYYCNQNCAAVLDDRNTLLGEDIYKEFLTARTWEDITSNMKKYKAKFFISNISEIPPQNSPLIHQVYSNKNYKLFLLKDFS